MNKLLIVDGHNLLFQMFFGMPARIVNKDGKAIQGTLGFVGALIKIIKMTSPTHVVVLFDGEHENDRAELLADYKANRTDYSTVPEEESPFSQLEDVYRALDCMGILHTEVAEYETDDVISSYVYTLRQQMEIVIASFDSDFFQLVDERVTVLRYRGDQTILCDSAYVYTRCGVTPDLYADFKSLTSDTADNIKGAHKVGPKTAAALLGRFGGLKAMIEQADSIEKPSIKWSIQENAERLLNNYRLIKLDDRAAIPFHVEALTYCYDGITTTQVLQAIGLR